MDQGPRNVAVVNALKTNIGARPSGARVAVVPRAANAVSSDEIEIARRRMHHLRYRNVEPLPTMHFVIGNVDQHLTAAQRASYQQIALHVLAVQMWQATARSALR